MMAERGSFLLPKDQAPSWSLLTFDRVRQLPRGDYQRHTCFWARNAIYHGLQALGVAAGDRVLLPAYLCAAAVEPILAYGAEVDFFEVRRDCQPDFADMERRISSRTRAVLAVHYFGFPQDLRKYREFCDRHQLALIEDCAHVLCSEYEGRPLGMHGDVSIFSWRKHLPIGDGGELVINGPNKKLEVSWHPESLLFTLKALKNVLDQWIGEDPNGYLKISSDLIRSAKGLFRGLLQGSGNRSGVWDLDQNSLSFDARLVDWPMSRLSQWMLLHTDVRAVMERRRRHYLFLEEQLSSIGGVTLLHPRLPPGVCPWILPVFLDGLPNAHLALRSLGVPAVTWGLVRHPQVSAEDFLEANFLFENLIFLPVHQNLREEHLQTIVDTVKAVCTSAGCQKEVVNL